MADVCVFEVLDFYSHIFGPQTFWDAFKAFPALLKLYADVGKMGNLPKWMKERGGLFQDWAEYAKEVDKTLKK